MIWKEGSILSSLVMISVIFLQLTSALIKKQLSFLLILFFPKKMSADVAGRFNRIRTSEERIANSYIIQQIKNCGNSLSM